MKILENLDGVFRKYAVEKETYRLEKEAEMAFYQRAAMRVMASRQNSNHSHSFGATAPAPAPSKIAMVPSKELNTSGMGTLAIANPHVIEALFRHRLVVSEQRWPPREWLNANCKGFYTIAENEEDSSYSIGFESDEDMLLFKMTYEGLSED